jgi:hypothetical protein
MLDLLIYIGIGVAITSVVALGLTVLAAIAIVFISGTDSSADDLDYDFED